MGRRRSLEAYLRLAGIDPSRKEVHRNEWCHRGEWPEEALPYRLPTIH
jgi:hypothetical protein